VKTTVTSHIRQRQSVLLAAIASDRSNPLVSWFNAGRFLLAARELGLWPTSAQYAGDTIEALKGNPQVAMLARYSDPQLFQFQVAQRITTDEAERESVSRKRGARAGIGPRAQGFLSRSSYLAKVGRAEFGPAVRWVRDARGVRGRAMPKACADRFWRGAELRPMSSSGPSHSPHLTKWRRRRSDASLHGPTVTAPIRGGRHRIGDRRSLEKAIAREPTIMCALRTVSPVIRRRPPSPAGPRPRRYCSLPRPPLGKRHLDQRVERWPG